MKVVLILSTVLVSLIVASPVENLEVSPRKGT